MLEDATVTCPACWEEISLELDLSVEEQDYVEDCPVCCRPMRVRYQAAEGVLVEVSVESAAD